MRADVDAEALTWIWHGLLLVGAVRRSISDDGFATGAVGAARSLGRLLGAGAPPGASGAGA